MNLDELSFVEEKSEGEDFEAIVEREKAEVQKILQSLEANRLKES